MFLYPLPYPFLKSAANAVPLPTLIDLIKQFQGAKRSSLVLRGMKGDARGLCSVGRG